MGSVDRPSLESDADANILRKAQKKFLSPLTRIQHTAYTRYTIYSVCKRIPCIQHTVLLSCILEKQS